MGDDVLACQTNILGRFPVEILIVLPPPNMRVGKHGREYSNIAIILKEVTPTTVSVAVVFQRELPCEEGPT